MSDLQTKLGGGLSILQDSLQQGKQKLQTVQEISQLKKTITELSEQRASQILKLGEEAYKKVRHELIIDTDLSELAQPLSTIDIQIFQIQQSLNDLNDTALSHNTCSKCGIIVNEQDKFCGGCGSPIEVKQQKTTQHTLECGTCNTLMPENAQFCGCCGVKLTDRKGE